MASARAADRRDGAHRGHSQLFQGWVASFRGAEAVPYGPDVLDDVSPVEYRQIGFTGRRPFFFTALCI